MGEIADMMLNGEMCEGCGEWLLDEDGNLEESGYPQYCSPSCARDRGASISQVKNYKPKPKKKPCRRKTGSTPRT